MARQERLNALVCQCLIIRGRIAIENGDYAGAIETLENALVAYEVIDQPDLYASCQQQLGRAWFAIGDFNNATRALNEAESTFLSVNDVVQSAYCLLGLSKIARVQEDFGEAVKLVSAARADFESAGARVGVAATDHLRGDIDHARGDLKTAETHYRSALELYNRVGSGQAIALELNLSWLLLAQGRHLEGKLLLDRIMETCEANGHAVLNIRAKANLLIYLAHTEDWFLWDSTLTYLDTHLSRFGLLDYDIAMQMEMSADMAHERGQSQRCISALELATKLWSGLQRSDRAFRLQEKREAIRGMFSTWS